MTFLKIELEHLPETIREMSEYYETRQEIVRKIHEMRDLVLKNQPPNTKGHLNEIVKAVRDGHKSEDLNYIRICFSIILDHILHLDETCNLSQDDDRLKGTMKALQEAFETG